MRGCSPIDDALTAAGYRSDRAVYAAGGPSTMTLRRLRRGGRVRDDSVARLAALLTLPEPIVRMLVEKTLRAVRREALRASLQGTGGTR
jgi:hypothetical protein